MESIIVSIVTGALQDILVIGGKRYEVTLIEV